MLKNKKVVKALTIGLATMMATPTMTAFAQVEGEGSDSVSQPTAVQATPIDASAAEKVVVPVESTNEQQIEDAQSALVTAEEAEKAVANEAKDLIRPFDGMSDDALRIIAVNEDNNIYYPKFDGNQLSFNDPDDSANEFEVAAGNDLTEAQNKLADGEKAIVEGEYDDEGNKLRGLNDVNENIQEARDESQKANTAALNAAAELLNVDDAKKAADAAQNSKAAQDQADLAKTASEKAENYAKEAEKEADNAQKAYEAAEQAWKEAKTIADKYNKEANDAIDAGKEDAKEAVERAKAAEKIAEGLEKEMKTYYDEAVKYEKNVKIELGKAQEDLNDLISKGQKLYSDYSAQEKIVGEKDSALKQMNQAVKDAEDALKKAPSQWDIAGLAKNVADLETALKKAESALKGLEKTVTSTKATLDNTEDPEAYAKTLISTINSNEDISEKNIELSEDEKAYEVAKKAVEDIKAAYNNAKAKKAEADGKISVITGEYGDIADIEKDILSKETTEKAEEARAKAVKDLIGIVASKGSNEKVTADVLIDESHKDDFVNGLYVTSDGRFFTYVVGEDDVISVINLTKEDVWGLVPQIKEATKNTYTEDEIEAILAALEASGEAYLKEDADPTYEPTVVGTGRYNVTYTEYTDVPTGKNLAPVKRGNNTAYDCYKGENDPYRGTLKIGNHIYNVRVSQGYDYKNHCTYVDWLIEDFGEYKGKYSYHKGSTTMLREMGSKGDDYRKNIYITNIPETRRQSSEKSLSNLSLEEANSYSTKDNFTKTEITTEGQKTILNYTVTSDILKTKEMTKDEYDEFMKTFDSNRLIKEVSSGDKSNVKVTHVDVITAKGIGESRAYHTSDGAPAFDEDGNYKNICEFTHGNHTYSTVNGDLRWNSNENRWEIKLIDQWNRQSKDFKSIASYYDGKKYVWGAITDNNLSGKAVLEYTGATKTTMTPEKAAEVTDCVAKITWQETKEVDTTKYVVYYKKTEDVNAVTGYQYKSGATNSIENLNVFNDLSKRAQDIITAKENYDKKAEAFEKADKAYQDALKAVNDQKDLIDGIKGDKTTDESKLKKAIEDRQKALNDLDEAKKQKNAAQREYNQAKGKLDKIGGDLTINYISTIVQYGKVGQLARDYKDAQDASAYWDAKVKIAEKLQLDAENARIAAENAQAKVDGIKESDLGAAALAKAEQELEIAKAAAEAAKAAAEQARKDADEAAAEYLQILDRVQQLINQENASKGGDEGGAADTTGDEGTTGTTLLGGGELLEETPGLAVGTGVGGVAFNAPGAPGAGEADGAGEGGQTLNITQQTATSDAVPSSNGDVELTNIDPNVAKAAELADSETLAWWWLVIIAAFGGAGFGLYKKFHGKKEENVTK